MESANLSWSSPHVGFIRDSRSKYFSTTNPAKFDENSAKANEKNNKIQHQLAALAVEKYILCLCIVCVMRGKIWN